MTINPRILVLSWSLLISCTRADSALEANDAGTSDRDISVAVDPREAESPSQTLIASVRSDVDSVVLTDASSSVPLTKIGIKGNRQIFATATPQALAVGKRLTFSAKDRQGAEVSSKTIVTLTQPQRVQLFLTPSTVGHGDFIAAIDRATTSMNMSMFHLTEDVSVQAVIRAQQRGVHVRLILDRKGIADGAGKKAYNALVAAGVEVKPSSSAFQITHEKAAVIDDRFALITTINLTNTATNTRDFGVALADAGVIKEFNSVFEADWQNADSGGKDTPPLSEASLLWSPVNSQSKLKALVDSATTTIEAFGENLGDQVIQDALIAAAGRGVTVRIVAPQCDKNKDPSFDLPFLTAMRAGSVDARAMPTPYSAEQPYIHAKIMIVDGKTAYLGSVNYSQASTTRNREVGIIITDAPAIAAMRATFESDWPKTVQPLACQN